LAGGANVVEPAVGGEGDLVVLLAGGAGGLDRSQFRLAWDQTGTSAPQSHSHGTVAMATAKIEAEFHFQHGSTLVKRVTKNSCFLGEEETKETQHSETTGKGGLENAACSWAK